MKKKLLLVLTVFLIFSNASFACCKCCPQGLTAANGQKACQNVFSFLTIDFSFLSPRATAADVHVGKPKCCRCHTCAPDCQQTCPCQPQCCPPCQTQYCPCPPQCCPCQPKCCPCNPQCPKQSMAPDDKKEIPVSNKQVTNKPCCPNPKDKKSMFRLDLFRTFKIQIL